MRTVGIVAKPAPEAVEAARKLKQWLEARKVEALLEDRAAQGLGLAGLPGGELARRAELLVVLGGDGTLIHAAGLCGPCEVPIFGVNMGGLGFMTEISPDEMLPRLERVLAGDFELEARARLRARLVRTNGAIAIERDVLNDVVINKGALARMIDIEATLDGRRITTYRGDGIVVATPTGSTAYSLSAGGPILHPALAAMVLSPICPHTVSQRPLVVGAASHLELALASPSSDVFVTLDGQQGLPLEPGDRVAVEASPHRVLLVKNPRLDFFQVLRTKLRWG